MSALDSTTIDASGQITVNSIVDVVKAEYDRVGFPYVADDGTELYTDDEIMSVIKDVIAYALYNGYEEYEETMPWEWSEYATDYHILHDIAYTFLEPLSYWPDDLIDFDLIDA